MRQPLSDVSGEPAAQPAAEVAADSAPPMTELRRTVFSLLVSARRPLTAYQLLDRLRAVWPGAAPPTVYRSLDFLHDQGLIHKLERSNAFVACTEPGQHTSFLQLLVCQTCGKVTELEDEAIATAILNAAESVRFQPSFRHVEIDGLCAQCAASAEPGGAHSARGEI
jgi:Fur family zinc uptake transcriptional regulator